MTPQDVLARLEGPPGVSQAELEAIASALNFDLPKDYAAFLLDKNGAQGSVNQYTTLMLYSVTDVYELTCMSRDFWPDRAEHLVVFGSDGSRVLCAFDLRSTPPSVVPLDYVELDSEGFGWTAPSFGAFLTSLAKNGWFPH